MQGARTPAQRAWRRLRKNPIALAAIAFILMACLAAIFAHWLAPDKSPAVNLQAARFALASPGTQVRFSGQPVEGQNAIRTLIGGDLNYAALAEGDDHGPNTLKLTYRLGADALGRDVFSRLLVGARISISVGLAAVLLSLFIGTLLGSLAGYFGGWTDKVISWAINVVWSIPTLLLVIAIAAALGRGFWQVFIAIGLTLWVEVARLVRGQVLSLQHDGYVEATIALGYRWPRTLFRHILPNLSGPLLIIGSANFATAILLEAGLSFIGIGVQPPYPSWGSMLSENYPFLLLGKAALALAPGICIMVLTLSFNILGNALRDAADVRR